MKQVYCRFAALLLASYASPVFAQVLFAKVNVAQDTAGHSAATTQTSKPRSEQMRLTTNSEFARTAFGQAVTLSGNYRLDECLKILRAAVRLKPRPECRQLATPRWSQPDATGRASR